MEVPYSSEVNAETEKGNRMDFSGYSDEALGDVLADAHMVLAEIEGEAARYGDSAPGSADVAEACRATIAAVVAEDNRRCPAARPVPVPDPEDWPF